MTEPAGIEPIVLVGAGHAHLHVLKNANAFRALPHPLLLIDPGGFWYSGMATGMLAGEYDPEQDRIDPAQLAAEAGIAFLRDAVEQIDPEQRSLQLRSGRRIRYRLLSLNIGSEVDESGWQQLPNGPQVHAVKPIPKLLHLHRSLEAAIRREREMPSVCVVGGGPTGCELAANLAGLARRLSVAPAVTLVAARQRLLPDISQRASDRLQKILESQGVTVGLGQRARKPVTGGIALEDGSEIRCAHVLLAVGLRARQLARSLPGASGEQGLHVNQYMQSTRYPEIFAAGDCADFQPRELPKLGVFGVRAAKIVHHNLRAAAKGSALKPYHPQRVWLAVLNLGDGRGFLSWWKFWVVSRWAHRLKEHLDLQFMKKHRPA